MSNPARLPALSARQEAFAVAYARHHNASQAARDANYSSGCASVTSTRLIANASVLARIRELEAQTAVDMGVSRAEWLKKLEAAAALAKEKQEPMAMIAAWREIGKACGFYMTDRVQVKVDLTEPGRLNHMERMTDAELLAIIASGGGGNPKELLA